jgi:carbon monoxide dehydrogenase subunit G
MHFEGEFTVPGAPDEVMLRFTDVERMARCVPGAQIDGRAEDGSYTGGMLVAFGPKRIKFRGSVACEFDMAARSGLMVGRGAADLRAARIAIRTRFTLHEAEGGSADNPLTLVKIVSEADLQGVLAEFARTGGVALAKVMMQDFARRAAEEFARPRSESDDEGAQPVQAHRLVWDAVKTQASSLAGRLKSGRGGE